MANTVPALPLPGRLSNGVLKAEVVRDIREMLGEGVARAAVKRVWRLSERQLRNVERGYGWVK